MRKMRKDFLTAKDRIDRKKERRHAYAIEQGQSWRMRKELWIPQVVSGAMLLWALYPDNPYGYYILLRWVVCPCFAFAAVQAFTQEKTSLVWVLGVTAAIYNPIIQLHLNRGLWSVLNLAGIGVGVWSVVVFKKGR